MLWQAWQIIIRQMAAGRPAEQTVAELLAELQLGVEPPGWQEELAEVLGSAQPDFPDGSDEQRSRFLMGLAMARLRGKVPARQVVAMVTRRLGICINR